MYKISNTNPPRQAESTIKWFHSLPFAEIVSVLPTLYDVRWFAKVHDDD
jgi:hypothetical protein